MTSGTDPGATTPSMSRHSMDKVPIRCTRGGCSLWLAVQTRRGKALQKPLPGDQLLSDTFQLGLAACWLTGPSSRSLQLTLSNRKP